MVPPEPSTMIARLTHEGRQRRFARFVAALPRPVGRPLRLLDVGGTWTYWSTMDWRLLEPVEIVLLNVEPQRVPPPFSAVVGDARDLSRYDDQSFDVVYSNSVIGHVGTREDQARMAREVRRVGRTYILQTPNHYFPIDWRTLVPGFHWLPAEWQAWAFLHMRVGTYRRTSDPRVAREWATRVRNLTRAELRRFFPEATIASERLAGLTKSLIVCGRHSGHPSGGSSVQL
jgi:hypothetical protein